MNTEEFTKWLGFDDCVWAVKLDEDEATTVCYESKAAAMLAGVSAAGAVRERASVLVGEPNEHHILSGEKHRVDVSSVPRRSALSNDWPILPN